MLNVINVTGNVTATLSNGEQISVSEGDILPSDAQIISSDGGTILTEQAGEITLQPGFPQLVANVELVQASLFDNENVVYDDTLNDVFADINGESPSTAAADIDTLLAGDGDILDALEETAAGGAGGGGGGGATFVQLSRIAEDVEPLTFDYTPEVGSPQDIEGDTIGQGSTQEPTTIDNFTVSDGFPPVVSGETNLDPNTPITISVIDENGDSTLVEAQTDEDGNFNFSLPDTLEDGNITVVVEVPDPQQGSIVVSETVTIDGTAPGLTIDPIDVTNNPLPEISGTSDLPSGSEVSVEIFDAAGNTQTLTALVLEDGSFSVTPLTSLSEGEFTINVSATDAAGNTTSLSAGGEADFTAPTLEASINNSDPTSTVISGNSDLPAGSNISIVVTDANGNEQTFDVQATEDGTFTLILDDTFEAGEYAVAVSATDTAGNTVDVTETFAIADSSPSESEDTPPASDDLADPSPVEDGTTPSTGEDGSSPTITITIDSVGAVSDSTPIISGTTDLPAGETVTLTVTDANGDEQTVTATVQPDGSFSADVPAELAEGEFTITAEATDAAGNTSTTSTSGTVDTTAPTVTLDAQGTGNDTTPTISGSTDLPPGETVTLTVTDANGDEQTVTATVQPDGSFSADVPAELAGGEFTVTAEVTDAAGNTTTTTLSGGEVDTTAPTVTLDAQGTGNDTTPTISGTTDQPAGETVTLTVTDANGDTQTITATVQPDGSFSADVPAELAEGEFTVTAEVTDAAGNTTTTTLSGGEVNTAAPTVTLDGQGTGNNTTPTVSGTTDLPAGDSVTLTVTDANGDTQTVTATVQPDGTFSADVPADLAEGEFTVTAEATDAAGNTTTTTLSGGEVDTTAPTVTLDPQGTGNDTTPTISGSTDLPPGETVTLTVTDANGDEQTITATVQPDESFSADVPVELAEGEFTVTAEATDAAGNTTTTTLSGGEVNTAAPTVTLDAQGTGNDTTPTISGTTDLPAGETVTLTVTDANGDEQTVTATVQPDGSFSADVPTELAEGEFTVIAEATDAAGNTTTTTLSGGEVNTASPTVTLDAQSTGNDTAPTISGTTDLPAGDSVTLTITDANGDEQTVTATVQPDGSFSADVPAELAEGNFTVTAEVTDAAGNTGTTSTSGTVDTTAPTVTLDAQGTGNDTTPAISGTTDLPAGDSVTLTITDANGDEQTVTATVQPDGSFSADVPAELAEGEFTVTAEVTDAAGNTTTTTLSGGEVNTAAPTVTLDAQGTGNDTTPTISGTTDLPAGDSVTLTITDANGDEQTVTATVQPDGSFSADVPAELAEGEFTVTAKVTDAAGNTTTTTLSGGEVNTAAPTVTLDAQGTGNDTTPTISGTTDLPASESVTLTVTDANGDEQTVTATVQPDGSFSADVPAELAEGEFTVTAEVTDAAGNTTTTTLSGGEVNTAAPTITLDQQGTGNDTTPTISGTTDLPAGESVTLTVTDANGDTQTVTATVQPDGSFSADVPDELAEGAFTVSAEATDVAGNTGTASTSGTVDTTAPTITLDEQGTGNDTTPTISGTTDLPAGESVTLTVTGANGDTQTVTATVQPDGTFSADVPVELAEGEFTVTVEATDAAGNTGTTSTSGTVDTTAPTITLDAQGTGNDTTPTISGTTDLPAGDSVTLTITDANGDEQTVTATVQPDGSFSADVPTELAEGEFIVDVTATDAAGNTGTTSTSGTVDTTAPTVTLDAQGTGNDTTPAISGNTDLPAGETVTLTVTDANGDEQTVTATVQPDGSFSADVPVELAEGEFTVTAEATDAAGNTTTTTLSGGEVDTTAPTVTLDPQGTGNDTTPTVSGTTDLPAGETVILTVTDVNGDTQTITATVQPDGSFSADVPAELAEGNFTVTAEATDAAGNTGTTSTSGTVDTTAPTVTLDAQGTGNDTTPTISGTTDLPAGETVTLTVTDANGDEQTVTATVQPDGTFSADVPAELAEGEFTVDVTTTDAAGNTGTTSTSGTVDTTAPTVTLDAQGTGNDTTPAISGNTDLPAAETVTLTVTDANGDTQTITATVQPDGTFSADVPAALAEGNFTVTAEVTDAAGNTGTASTSGTVDTTAPTVTLDPQGTGNDTTPTISGTTDLPAGETVTLTVTDANGDTQTVTATIQPDGSFSADVPAELADGEFTVTAEATDAAGNTTTTTLSGGEVNTAAPTVTLDAQGTGNDTTPTISGTTDLPAGETVTLTVTDANGDEQTVTATVQPDGSFSADVPAELAEGEFTVTAEVTNAAGNTGTASTSGTVDSTAPTITLDAQGTGNDTTPTISGTTDLPAGETVILTVTDANGDTQTVTATVQPDGSFSADVPAELADGEFTVTAEATDAAGNTTTTTLSGGEVNTAAPTVTLDAQGTGNDTTPTISGTIDLPAGETVTLTVTDANGDEQTVTATVQPDGSFSADVPAELAEGEFTVTAEVTNAAGNTGTASTSGTVDSTAPTITLDAQGTGNDTTPTISGTTDLPAGETVILTVTDANGDTQTVTATVQPDGSFSADVPAELADGEFTVTAEATDAAGNTGTTSTSGTVDTTAPTVTLDAQGTGNDTTPTISGTTDLPAGETVTLTVTDANGDTQTVTATVQPDGTFSADVPAELDEGEFTVDVTATDAAGNTGTTSTSGTVDTTAPTVTLDAQGTGNDTTPTISGNTDLPAGETVILTVTDVNGDTQTITATVQPDGTFSADVPAELAEGEFTVDVTATDAAGNTGTTSTSGTVDTTAPTVTLDAQGTGNDTTPTISGTTDLSAGETVTLTVTDANGDTQTVTTTVKPDGTFSADMPAELAEGEFTVDVTATDAAGNTGTASTSGTVDTTAPTVTLDAQGTGNDTTPTISGSTDLPAGETVTLTVTDANGDTQTVTATVQPDGTFSADMPAELAEGEFTVTAEVTDAAGNTGTTSTSGTVDTTAPTVTLDAQGTGNDTTPTISGTTDLPAGDSVTLTITDANGDEQTVTATVQPDGSFSADVPTELAEGEFTVTAEVTNAAGNTGTASTSGTVDSTAPTITLDAQGTGNDTTPTISGTTDLPAGDSVTLTITDANGDEQTVTATVQPDGSFSADVPTELAEGEFTVDVAATDAAGNTGMASTSGRVDTTAPTVTLDAQGTGNDTTPTISGTTDLPAGETVNLTVTDANGDTQTVTATVQPDGTFSVDVPAELAEGEFTVDAAATDAAGNTGTASTSGTVDTTAPTVTLDPQGTGNDATPTISGTTDLPAGETVTLTVTDANGDTQTVTATVQPDGTFSADVPAELAEGEFTVDVTATDAAGNTGTTSTSGTVDTTAPTVTLDAQGTGNDTTPTISGNTDLPAGETVILTVTDVNGDTQTITATVQPDGTFSADVPAELAEGEFTVDAAATDAAGNTGTTSTSGTVDTTAPTVTLDAQGTGNDTTPTISGTTDLPAGETVTLTVTDANGDTQTVTTTVKPDGTFSADMPAELAEGEFTVTAEVTDAAGNTGTASTSGTVDTTAPTVTLDPQGTGNDTTPAISGTTDLPAGETVTLTVTDANGDTQTVTATVQPDGTFSADVPAELAEGEFTVDVTATDAAGNTGTTSTSGTVDTTAPTVTLDAQGTGNDTTPTISGTTDLPAGDSVTLTITDANGDEQTVTATVQPDGSFSADVPTELAEGEFTVDVAATDAAGNTGMASTSGRVDTTAPTVTLDAQGTGNDTTPTISGTTDLPAGETVNLTVTDANGDTQTVTATVQPDGTFSVDVPAELAEGEFTVDVTATDAAGNTGTTSTSGTVDTTAPTVTLDAQGTGNDTTPTISGTTDLPAGETVTLTVTDANGDTQTVTATVQPDGTFSVDVPAELAEGEFTVTAEVTDPAGNTGTASTSGTVDTTPPAVSLNITTTYDDATPLISGSLDIPEGNLVSITVTDARDNVQTFSAPVTADGTFNIEVPSDLAEGDFTVTTTATDEAGNTATATATGNVDLAAPYLYIDPINTTNDNSPTISGATDVGVGTIVLLIVTDANGIEYNLSTLVQADGSWSTDAPVLPDGSLSVQVQVLDEAGNIINVSAAGTIDTANPGISLDTFLNTNDVQPTISGTSDELGASVVVVLTDGLGIEQTLSATVQPDGTWSVKVPSDLNEGVLTIEASIVDDAGNLATVSTSGLIDLTLPLLNINPLANLNSDTPLISGTSDEIGALISIATTDSNGDTQSFTTTVLGDGTWSIALPAAASEGLLDVNVSVLDDAGNVATVSTSGLIDLTLPLLNLNPLANLNSDTPLISGTSDEIGAEINIATTDSNGDTQSFTTTVLGDGTWSIALPAAASEGLLDVNVSVLDDAGNVATVSTSGLIDLTLPLLNINPLANLNSDTPLISGTSDEIGAVINIATTDSNGDTQSFTTTVLGDGTWSIALPAAASEGLLDVNVSVLDDAGNVATVSTSGLIDLTLPLLNLNPLANLNSDTPLISGTSDEIGALISIATTDSNGDTQSFTTTVLGDGTWSIVLPTSASEGLLDVNVSVLDDAGNVATVSTSGLIDLTLPLLNINPLANLNSDTPLISGTSDEIGAVINIATTDSNGDTQSLTTTVLGDGTWSIALPAAASEGLLDVNVSVLDDAGNVATVSTSGLIDLTLPLLNINPLANLNSDTPLISGTSDEIGALISIATTDSNGDTQSFTTTVLGDGTWSIVLPTSASEGLLDVNVSVLDDAGNVATVSTSGLIDLTLPLLNINPLSNLNSDTPLISGTSDEIGAVINIATTDSNGDTQSLTTTVLGDGTWSIALPAAASEGLLDVNVSVLDDAGNVATVSTSGLIDLTLPLLNINPLANLNSDTPLISGTSDEIGALISIATTDSNGDTQSFTTTVLGDGTWSIVLPTSASEGLLDVNVSVLDDAGNVATVSTSGLIDLTLPLLNINPLANLNSDTPLISGTSDEIGAVINIATTDSNGDTQAFTTTVLGDGTWSIALPAAASEGLLDVNVSVLDDAGNVATVSTSGLIDLTLPLLNINPLSNLNSDTPLISGTSDEIGALISIATTDSNGDTQSFTTTVLGDGTWSIALPAAASEGLLDVNVSVLDDAGNVATVSTSGLIDLTLPLLNINPLANLNSDTPLISGTSDEIGAVINIATTDSNGDTQSFTTTVLGDGTWSIALPAAASEGLLDVNVSVLDDAGNVATVSTSGLIDLTLPLLNINPLANLNSDTPLISGTSDEIGALISIATTDSNGDTQAFTTTVLGDGTWSIALPAAASEGLLDVNVSVLDDAGNVATVSTSGLIDLTLPLLNINPLANLNSDTPLISGTSDEIGALISIATTDSNGDTQAFTTTVLGDGTWSIALPAAASEGLLDVNVSVLDDAGNVATVSTSGLIDLTLPLLNINPLANLNSDTPLISGTSDEIGAVINIATTDSNGDTQAFTTTVLGDGTWSIALPAAASEGLLDVNVSVLDDAGNVATVSTSGLIDLTLPLLNINPLANLNSDTPLISGTSDEIGAVINIATTDSNGDTQAFTTTVLGDGTWSIALPAAASEGLLDVNVSVLDDAGNVATVSTSGLIDLTLPLLNINPLANLNSDTPLISGTSDEIGAVINIATTDSNGDTQSFTTTVLGDGTWSIALPAAASEGLLDVNVSVLDDAGNVATVSTSGLIDLTLPLLNINPLANLNSDTPLISGTSDEIGALISIATTDSNGDTQSFTTTVLGDGTWSIVLPTSASEGLLDVNVSVLDDAGNVATVSTSGLIDLTLPLLNINPLANLNSDTPLISGTSDEIGALISIATTDSNGDTQAFTTTVLGDGTWSIALPAAASEGLLDVNVSVLDDAGNVATVSTSGLIDLTLPLLNINPLANLNSDTPLISGTSDEIGAVINIATTDSNGDTQAFTTTVLGDGTWSIALPAAASEGLLDVNVSVLDDAGNVATVSTSGLIDLTLPLLNINPLANLNSDTPLISGTSDEIGAVINIATTDSNGDTQAFTTTVLGDGTWSIALPAAASEGLLDVNVSVLDDAGNVATVSTSGLIDLTLPLLNINPLANLNSDTPLISGTSDEIGAVINIATTDSNGDTQSFTTTVIGDGTWSIALPAAASEGLLDVNVSVLDDAGNVATVSTSGLIDLTLPLLNLNPLANLNSDTPLISGTSDEIGAVINIATTDSNGDTQSFTTTVLGDGTWSIALPAAASEGLLDVNVSVLDDAGNVATVSTSGLIDLTLPLLNINPLANLNSDTPLISGTSDEIGALLSIATTDSNGDTQSFTTTVLGDGTWSIALPAAASEGLLDVNVSVLDDAGNVATVSTSGLIDLTLPLLNINPLANLNSDTPLISGTSDEIGALISIATTDSNGDTQAFTTTVLGDGTWSIALPAAASEGLLDVNVSVLDDAGNVATVSTSGLIDLTLPLLNINPLANLNSDTPLISGTSDEIGAVINIATTDSNGDTQAFTTTVLGDGTWSIALPAAASEGLLDVNVSVLDDAGNVATVSTSGLIDLTLPLLNINPLSNLNSDTPLISGTSDEIGALLSIATTDSNGDTQSFTTTVLGDGTWSITLPAAASEGLLDVNVSVLDDAGNVATVSTSGLIDLTLPLLTVDAIGLINDATPTISGTSDEIGAQVSILATESDGSTQSFDTIVQNDGTFNVDIPTDVAEGILNVDVTVLDLAGNLSLVQINGEIDITPPSLAVTQTPTLLSPVVSGTADPESVGLYVDVDVTANILGLETNLSLRAQIQEDGTWTTLPIADLGVGPVSLSVSLEDEAGNMTSINETASVSILAPESGGESASTDPGTDPLVTVNLLGNNIDI